MKLVRLIWIYLLLAVSPLYGNIGDDSDTESSNRINKIEGSKSDWSGQLLLNYEGSTIADPFSVNAPNPGNLIPPPKVKMTGTVALRYRLNKDTTFGLGTGLTTQTPFKRKKKN